MVNEIKTLSARLVHRGSFSSIWGSILCDRELTKNNEIRPIKMRENEETTGEIENE